MVALLVVLTILVFVTVDYFVQRRRGQPAMASALAAETSRVQSLFGRGGYRVPRGVFFDPGHTWLYLEDTGTARVGINDFAQSVVGEIDSIDAVPAGTAVKRGDVIVTLHHGGREAKFRSPVDGVIEQVNLDLLEREEILSIEPQTASWLFRIRPTDTSGLAGTLLLGKAARDWLSHEISRMKVFVSTLGAPDVAVGHTMQDGGLPAWGLIDFLSDDDWHKVQDAFFTGDRRETGRQ